MKALVVYESVNGNTEQIAKAIANAIGRGAEARRPSSVSAADLAGVDLLIIGAPTYGGRPYEGMKGFLDGLPALAGKRVAAFDTRLTSKLVGIFGFAAGKIGRALQDKGATLVVPPEGFFVLKTKGPLKDGEVQRAGAWANEVAKGAG